MTHNISKNSRFVEVWECLKTQHKSLHAALDFYPDDIISRFGAKQILDQPNYLSLQIDRDRHIILEPECLQYTNHSCDPNIHFDTTTMQVIALRKITTGDELTFFYPATEWSMNRGFDCLCNSSQCLQKIYGASQLDPDVLKKYQLSEHIQKLLNL